jgi:hypothetical protein
MHVELLHLFSAKNSGKMARGSLRERQSKGETMSAGKFYTRRGTMERIRCIMCFVQSEPASEDLLDLIQSFAVPSAGTVLMWLFDSTSVGRLLYSYLHSIVIIVIGIDISSYY